MSKKTLYWVTTLGFLIPMAGTGVLEVLELGPPHAAENMIHLGYPLYFLRLLGAVKILGFCAIITNRFPKIKEWAYAGFVFDLIGAVISHLVMGDYLMWLSPFGFLICVSLSYWLWQSLRTSIP